MLLRRLRQTVENAVVAEEHQAELPAERDFRALLAW